MELFNSAILKLTAYYLATIMVISICFSVILYQVYSSEIDRSLRTFSGQGQQFYNNFDGVEQLRQQRVAESKEHLVSNLILVNLATLVVGGGGSYLLARRTLKPIQDAMDAQNRFTSDASHELRTPLAAMQTEVEVALRAKQLSKDRMRALLGSVLEEVHKLRSLSDRLLQLSNNKHLAMTPINIEDSAIEAVSRMVSAAQAKQITIQNNIAPLRVKGNKDALADVLTVLVDNAIKYSPAKTVVTLSSKKRDGSADIIVADQGMGIKATELPHIFDRFYRADSSRAKQNVEGYGLGLSIAKQLVEQHKGTIVAASAPDKGTTFTITLPLLSAPSQKS